MPLEIDGGGPIAEVFRRSLEPDLQVDCVILCRSLSALPDLDSVSRSGRPTMVSVNGLSADLRTALEACPTIGAINFTAWFGMSGGKALLRQRGLVLAHYGEVAQAVASRVATAFGLEELWFSKPIDVQVAKLAVNLPGVAHDLALPQHGRRMALRLEVSVLQALARYSARLNPDLPDIPGFAVGRLLELVGSRRIVSEAGQLELETLIGQWRSGRVAESVRRIRLGRTGAMRDLALTLCEIGTPPDAVADLLKPYEKGVSCQS